MNDGRALTLRWRIGAGMVALVIPVMLVVVPLDRLVALLGRHGTRPKPGPPDRLVASWVDYLMHRLPGPWRHTCLRRSLVLYHLLRRAGRPVELRIGVRRDDQAALAAHAWLMLDGEPYVEGGTEHPHQFAEIARFPGVVRPR